MIRQRGCVHYRYPSVVVRFWKTGVSNPNNTVSANRYLQRLATQKNRLYPFNRTSGQ
jgi:hypothetical protein